MSETPDLCCSQCGGRADVLEALVIRPGDKLMLRYGGMMSAEHAQRIKDQISGALDIEAGDDVVIVCCDQIAVFRA